MTTLEDVLGIDIYLKLGDPRISRSLGCMFGAAAGSAMNSALHFALREEIPSWIRSAKGPYSKGGVLDDGIQLSLFTGEGLLRAQVRHFTKGIGPIYRSVVTHAYLRWLAKTHEYSFNPNVHCDGWLYQVKGRRSRTATDKTSLRSLKALYAQAGWNITNSQSQTVPNRSRSCGALLRATPLAVFPHCDLHKGENVRELFELACELGQITHGHPDGYIPAAVLVLLVAFVLQGDDLERAVRHCLSFIRHDPDARTTASLLEQALAMSSSGELPAERFLEELGGGYYAHEALALAVCFSLCSDSFDEAMVHASRAEDGDAVAAITGAIVGAALGIEAIDPQRWLLRLEFRDAIRDLSFDLVSWPSWDLDSDETWTRYPGH